MGKKVKYRGGKSGTTGGAAVKPGAPDPPPTAAVKPAPAAAAANAGAKPGAPPAPVANAAAATAPAAVASSPSTAAPVSGNKLNRILALIIQWLAKVTAWIFSKLSSVFPFLLSRQYPIAHYVALALVIAFLIGGIGFLVGKKKKKKTKEKKSFVERLLGYRTSNLFQQLSTPVTDPRPTITGRCDNVDFVDKGNGICVSSQTPNPIEWIIDSENIPELKELPLDIQRRLSNDGAKFKVTIPWKTDGLVYTPDCDKAMFSDGTPAYLLKDNGSICKKLELDKIIELSKYRYIPEYSKYTGLNNFVDEDANSSVIEKVSPGEVCSIQAAKDLGIFDNTRFYKPGYDTIRSYNKNIDKNGAFSHKLCSENTIKDEAAVLCPLVKNAGIGFTSKPGSKCVTSECPTGFTEDKNDPMVCNKPLKDKVVQLNSRNDEQYDDWYTIPNYHLGNKYATSNDVYLGPCPAGSIPYYATDAVDNTTAGWGASDQIDVCIDKSLYFGGKYGGTSDYCPAAMIKRVGSSTRDLVEDYVRLTNNDNLPASVKDKIKQVVGSITADTFTNLQLLTDEMDSACDKLNLDTAKLKDAYAICEQLYKNEDGFVAKFAGDVGSLIKLRKDATKYSCQQLFGIPLEERANPIATNKNATRIDKPPLNFPDIEKIQFEQYINEYEKEVKSKDISLPPITSNEEKQMFINSISKGIGGYVALLIIIIIVLLIYNYRRCIWKFFNCTILSRIGWIIDQFNLTTELEASFNNKPICTGDCTMPVNIKTSNDMTPPAPVAKSTPPDERFASKVKNTAISTASKVKNAATSTASKVKNATSNILQPFKKLRAVRKEGKQLQTNLNELAGRRVY